MRFPTDSAEPSTLAALRWLLLALLAAGMIGMGTDLLLLDHYEDGWQLPPLVLIALGLCAAAWVAGRGSAAAVAALRWTMWLFVAAGAIGIGLHFAGNREFQKEIDPTIAGWPLFVKVMTAKAPPALAPASMIQLGLLGLLFTYRHPAFARRASAFGEAAVDGSARAMEE
jgi:hypothetical protein